MNATTDARTHYEVLGVAMDAAAADIKRAWKHQAKRVHSDSNPDVPPEAFLRLRAAYECLRDPERRTHYDAILAMEREARARRKSAPPPPPPPAPPSPPPRHEPPQQPPPASASGGSQESRPHASRDLLTRLDDATRMLDRMIRGGMYGLAPGSLQLFWSFYGHDPKCADLLDRLGFKAGHGLWREGKLEDAATCLRFAAAGLFDTEERARAARDLSRVESALRRRAPRARAKRAAAAASLCAWPAWVGLGVVAAWLMP